MVVKRIARFRSMARMQGHRREQKVSWVVRQLKSKQEARVSDTGTFRCCSQEWYVTGR